MPSYVSYLLNKTAKELVSGFHLVTDNHIFLCVICAHVLGMGTGQMTQIPSIRCCPDSLRETSVRWSLGATPLKQQLSKSAAQTVLPPISGTSMFTH